MRSARGDKRSLIVNGSMSNELLSVLPKRGRVSSIHFWFRCQLHNVAPISGGAQWNTSSRLTSGPR
jgi:hypothetical protein